MARKPRVEYAGAFYHVICRGNRLRVIYLYLPEQSWVFLLDIYGKDDKDDLGREEKKVLASLASRIKEAAKGRSKGG